MRIARSCHSRQLCDPLQQLALKMLGSLVRISSLAQLELRHRCMLRIETNVHGQGVAQTAKRDKGSRHRDTAKGDLRREQDITKRPSAACECLASAALDRVIWIGFEYLTQWHYAEQNA